MDKFSIFGKRTVIDMSSIGDQGSSVDGGGFVD